MNRTVTLGVPNAILFVFDPVAPDVVVPAPEPGSLVAATGTCVSICTQIDVDGDTEVTLAGAPFPVAGLVRAGGATVAVRSGTLAVETCERHRVAAIEVPLRESALTVWVNDDRFPSRVVIVVEGEGG